MKPLSLFWILIFLVTAAVPAALPSSGMAAGASDLAALGQEAVIAAKTALAPHPIDACITNAGSASFENRPACLLLDILAGQTNASPGRGSLLSVHGSWADAPWAAFISRPSPEELLMVLVRIRPGGTTLAGPLDVRVTAGTEFGPFKAALGKDAFSLVTLANGWADGVPAGLMAGSLYHDHLCCGVSTGYLTTRFILDRFPLSGGQSYIYIGVPAWCQDDLIMTALNLTPGKHGYVTMNYPWNRPWQSSGGSYKNLGGIIIRREGRGQGGEAWVLSYNWRPEDFKAFAGIGDGPLDWKNKPWLHVLYNRFLATRLDRPQDFVSVLKHRRLDTAGQIDQLIRLGANPLEILLGEDPGWNSPGPVKSKPEKKG
ncbi:MAG: hypothetical protein HUN04_20405 [Desulfobacter sp.]|nr:MAG: hypothetical protein HUN04_20405 [Desulfobacter sp.]